MFWGTTDFLDLARTYQFQYAPFFSLLQDLTIISTNSGDVGNAHSELIIGPLAEMGLFGSFDYVIIY